MLIHADVWQKPSQYCKNNYPLIKKTKYKKRKVDELDSSKLKTFVHQRSQPGEWEDNSENRRKYLQISI